MTGSSNFLPTLMDMLAWLSALENFHVNDVELCIAFDYIVLCCGISRELSCFMMMTFSLIACCVDEENFIYSLMLRIVGSWRTFTHSVRNGFSLGVNYLVCGLYVWQSNWWVL